MLLGHNTTQTSISLWTAAMTIPESSGKTKGKSKKSEIIYYPLFDTASTYTSDPYWKSVFHNCSLDKFPRGFTFTNGILRHRNSTVGVVLPEHALTLLQTTILYFQEYGKMYSKVDQENRRRKEELVVAAQLENMGNDWPTVARSKNRRATYVRDYVERKYPHLTKYIRDEIYTQINVGFEMKYLTKDDVDYKNGIVVNVDGVDADQNGVKFTRPYIRKKATSSSANKDTKPKIYQHYENWLKSVEDYQKYLVNSTKASHTTVNASSYIQNSEDCAS